MNHEIYVDTHSYYLAVLRDDGGCVAVEMFDKETLCSPDGDMAHVLRECFEQPENWKKTIAHGMGVPLLVHGRKLLSDECDLIAWTMPDGKWHLNADTARQLREQFFPGMIGSDRDTDCTDYCEG